MSKKSKKSGREVRKLRKQPLRIRAGEFFERVGDHFVRALSLLQVTHHALFIEPDRKMKQMSHEAGG